MSTPGSITPQMNALLSGLQNQFAYAGSTSSFGLVQGISGAFTSLSSATGMFGSVNAPSYYSSGQLLTSNPGVFVGSLASTGAGTMLYNPIMSRGTGVTPSYTGTLVNGLALSAGWNRAQYSIALSVPSGATVRAQCVLAGTTLADSQSQQSNIAPTSSIGVVTAAVQSTTLSGSTHFVNASTGASFAVTLTSSAGVPVVSSGSLELFQLV